MYIKSVGTNLNEDLLKNYDNIHSNERIKDKVFPIAMTSL